MANHTCLHGPTIASVVLATPLRKVLRCGKREDATRILIFFMHEIIRGEGRPPTHGVQPYVQSQEVPTHSHAEQRWTLDTVWWDVVIHGGWAWRASRYAKAWFRKEAKG